VRKAAPHACIVVRRQESANRQCPHGGKRSGWQSLPPVIYLALAFAILAPGCSHGASLGNMSTPHARSTASQVRASAPGESSQIGNNSDARAPALPAPLAGRALRARADSGGPCAVFSAAAPVYRPAQEASAPFFKRVCIRARGQDRGRGGPGRGRGGRMHTSWSAGAGAYARARGEKLVGRKRALQEMVEN
jgi:hypothetical protein